jgi:6-phosphogluconolactonase
VLTGGSTAERPYELAARSRADWSDVELWWGDERCVPPTHEWSNYALAERSLLRRVEIPPRAVHRIRGELPPEEAASAYEEELDGTRPDLVLLGIGLDGHAASIFPRSETARERERLVVSAPAQLEPFVDRVTMTIPALESAPLVVFLAVGPAKADAARRAFVEPPSEATPASLIRSRTGRTIAILDPAAAQRLGI